MERKINPFLQRCSNLLALLVFLLLHSCTTDWAPTLQKTTAQRSAASLHIKEEVLGQKTSSIREEEEVVKNIKLVFAGDIMGHTPQIRSAQVEKNKRYDYRPCFEYIAPIIQSADLAIGNLEVTLPGKPPYSGYPIFRSPDDLARALKWTGFDVLVTANNHSNDAGKEGVIQTIETLKTMGIQQTGTFKSEAERAIQYPLFLNKNGIKIALLNYTYGTNGIPTRPPTIVNPIHLHTISKDVKRAKRRQADFIIVFLHWGEEYALIENSRQRYLANWLSEQGVDLIIGAHPHVVQPIEIVDGITQDGKKQQSLIAYSLGNFVSNQEKKNTDGGILLEVELNKSMTKDSSYFSNARFIPIWRYIEQQKKKNTYRVLPVAILDEEKESFLELPKKDKSIMLDYLRVTRSRLRHNGATERRIFVEDILPTNKK